MQQSTCPSFEKALSLSLGTVTIPQKWVGKLRGSILWWEWGHSHEFRIELSNHNAVDEEWSTEEIECPAPAGLSSSIFGAKLKQSQTWNWKIKCNGPQRWKPLQQSDGWSEKEKHLKRFFFFLSLILSWLETQTLFLATLAASCTLVPTKTMH